MINEKINDIVKKRGGAFYYIFTLTATINAFRNSTNKIFITIDRASQESSIPRFFYNVINYLVNHFILIPKIIFFIFLFDLHNNSVVLNYNFFS